MNDFDKLVFVDTETTGGNFEHDRIIDIGMIRVEYGKIVRGFTTLIDPGKQVPEFVLQMTGISSSDLEKSPTFRQTADEILEMMQDCIFVAHNSRFDYGLLKSEFRRLGIDIKLKQLCTVKLSKALRPDESKHNLDAVIERYGLTIENRHRALPDAQAVQQFFFKAREIFGEEKLTAAIKTAMKHPNLPVALDEEQLEELPENPGVYIFYGPENTPIYIGKSINIKERVKSHFADANRIQTELILAQNVVNIETIETGGELGALLKETELIKKEKPLYNRMLREAKILYFLVQNMNGKYKNVHIEEGEWPSGEVMGVFKSKAKAMEFLKRRTRKFKLCEKIMGMQKTRKVCFDREIGRCNGACEGKEDPVRYNMRFDMAFADAKVKAWPFGGPIVIKEKSDHHVFDRWCYLGVLNQEEDLPELHFDVDTYKILIHYINKKDNWKKIKVCKTTITPKSEHD